jgi:hypothetical protein
MKGVGTGEAEEKGGRREWKVRRKKRGIAEGKGEGEREGEGEGKSRGGEGEGQPWYSLL